MHEAESTVRSLETTETPAEPKSPEDAKKSPEKPKKSDIGSSDPKPKPYCPSFESKFNIRLVAKDAKSNKGKNFCTEVEHSCCGDIDLLKLASWWSGKDGTSPSRSELRKEKLKAIAFYTSYLLKNDSNLISFSNSLIAKDSKASKNCKAAGKGFLDLKVNGSALVEKWTSGIVNCSGFVNKLQTTILCGACDPKLQSVLNFKDNKVLQNSEGCKGVKEKCLEATKLNLKKVFPFVMAVEKQSRCSLKGNDTDQEELKFDKGNELLKVGDLEKEELFDENVCPRLVGIGSGVNLNSEGNAQYQKDLYMRLVKLMPKFENIGESGENKKVEMKKEEEIKTNGRLSNTIPGGHRILDSDNDNVDETNRVLISKLFSNNNKFLKKSGFEKSMTRVLEEDQVVKFEFNKDTKVNVSAKLTSGGFDNIDVKMDELAKLDGSKLLTFCRSFIINNLLIMMIGLLCYVFLE